MYLRWPRLGEDANHATEIPNPRAQKFELKDLENLASNSASDSIEELISLTEGATWPGRTCGEISNSQQVNIQRSNPYNYVKYLHDQAYLHGGPSEGGGPTSS